MGKYRCFSIEETPNFTHTQNIREMYTYIYLFIYAFIYKYILERKKVLSEICDISTEEQVYMLKRVEESMSRRGKYQV